MRFLIFFTRSFIKRFLLLFIVCVSLGIFLVTTTPGLFLSLQLLNVFLPGNLSVLALKGRAIDHLTFDELIYTTPEEKIVLNKVDLHWRLQDLLRHQLTITQFHADSVSLLGEKGNQQDKALIPQLAVDLALHHVTINTLTIQNKKHQHTLQQIEISARLNHDKWQITHAHFTFREHQFGVNAELETQFPYPLTATMQIMSPLPNKSALAGHVEIKGDFLHYQTTGELTHPLRLKMNGSIKHGDVWHIEAQGEQFNWPLTHNQTLYLSRGDFILDGTWPHLQANLMAKLNTPLPASLQLTAQTTLQGASSNAVLTTTDGSLQMTLLYNKTASPGIQGSINVKAFENSATPSPLKNLRIIGQFKGDALDDLKGQSNINALYFNTPFTATLNYLQQKLDAKATLGQNQLRMTGGPLQPWTLSGQLPQPALLYPALQGLQTHFSIEGKLINVEEGALAITMNKGKWVSPDAGEVAFNGATMQATLMAHQLKATGKLLIDGSKTLSLALQLPAFHLNNLSSKQAVQGQLQLQVNSLAFLQQLNPWIKSAEGRLQANLTVKGQLDKPEIEGTMQLINGHFSLPEWGIDLNPVRTDLQSHERRWTATGTLVSNGVPLTLHGEGSFFPRVAGSFAIDGTSVPLMNTPEYKIYVSPRLTVAFAPDLLSLRGTLLIPKADIRPQVFTSTVSLTDDAVFVSDTPAPNPLNLDTDVQVEMGNEVALVVKGLQGLLTGSIHLRQYPQKPLTATGELNVKDGKYQAYGQDLIIDEGKLLFNGERVDNPAIRIRAIKQFKNGTSGFNGTSQLVDFKSETVQSLDFGNKTTVGIEVLGRLTTPKIHLFSIPANLSEADILSMLLLGKPANQANKAGGQLLLAAVSALNPDSGKTQLLEQLKQTLGIDFNVENNSEYNQKTNQSTDKTAFVVGKSLSKRVYLSYNMGLSQTDSNMLTLKYLLNQFFSIQVNASTTGSGIDLLYTHQKE